MASPPPYGVLSSGTSRPLSGRQRARRQRLLTRALPLAALALVVAVVAVALIAHAAGSGARDQRALVRRYERDWSAGDLPGMYALLSPAAQATISPAAFDRRIETQARIATAETISFARPVRLAPGTASALATVTTTSFGTLHEILILPLDPTSTHLLGYAPEMTFPGLSGAETLRRSVRLGRRGDLLADDGSVLAAGATLSSPLSDAVTSAIVGALGPIPARQRAHDAALGYPADAQVGQYGLELVFQSTLAGRPGGTLSAGRRVLARRVPMDGHSVRTTINPSLESAVVSTLGNSYAGISVIDDRTGAIEAAAGLAFTDLQPPGSTFKIITTSAALSDGVATPDTVYPDATQADIGGFLMQNAAGEDCGGTLTESFATSCDTVFAPLGIQIGGDRLVAMAKRYGFDEPTGIPSALSSLIPDPIGDATAVGQTAIGQGQLQASSLEMADVAATIADHGLRALPTFQADRTPHTVRVVSPKVAADIQAMMVQVVENGTGTNAAIPGYTVAGKTGTAELRSTAGQANDAKATDGWFVGYVVGAPHRADVTVCAVYPADGYGADSAAPAVQQVLESALGLG